MYKCYRGILIGVISISPVIQINNMGELMLYLLSIAIFVMAGTYLPQR